MDIGRGQGDLVQANIIGVENCFAEAERRDTAIIRRATVNIRRIEDNHRRIGELHRDIPAPDDGWSPIFDSDSLRARGLISCRIGGNIRNRRYAHREQVTRRHARPGKGDIRRVV